MCGWRPRYARTGCLLLLLLTAGCPGDGVERRGGGPGTAGAEASTSAGWSDGQRELLRSLWLGSLPPLEASRSNRVADDPRAASLGHRLFFDARLSANGRVACATCHRPEHGFAEPRPRSRGVGETVRNAPTVIGAAYSPWQFWDGRRDSLWSQALSPLESPEEMGSTRLAVVRLVTRDPDYADDYRALFGPPPDVLLRPDLPQRAGPFAEPRAREAWQALSERERAAIDRAFANVGKAIEAYERLLLPAPSRFDRYVEKLLSGGDAGEAADSLDPSEVAGLRLFIDPERTACLRCHNGPLLTNHSFHVVATGGGEPPDLGRLLGVQAVVLDAFNCLGPHSDADPVSCDELRFMRGPGRELNGAFKTPTLRSVSTTAPYFHDGSRRTLQDVIAHYLAPPAAGDHELPPLALDPAEVRQLIAFLATLDGGVAAHSRWLAAPADRAAASPPDGIDVARP